jgi:hypothetical protein
VIPPRKDAKIWQRGNRKGRPHPRDENLRSIRKHGRKCWKRDSGYHRRSCDENYNHFGLNYFSIEQHHLLLPLILQIVI